MTIQWEQQPGGLHLAVGSFDKTMASERDAIAAVMHETVQKVAKTHGTSLSEAGFQNNMHALFTGDIRADLFLAKWEICSPDCKIIGAGLNWDTVGVANDGALHRAVYTEDLCLLTSKLRELIRAQPADKSFPHEGLAECFERISLQNMLNNNGASWRFGEVDLDNTRMMCTLRNNGAIIGNEADSAVLEFKSMPNDLMDRLPMDIKIINLRKNGHIDQNNFVTRWHEGIYDIRFIVTKGRATALGTSRADIRPWHNGKVPDQEILECVMAASLLAIKHKVEEKGWSAQQTMPSDSIFGEPMPEAHVFILGDQKMLEGFMGVGAKPRLFGTKPMMPGVNYLKLAA